MRRIKISLKMFSISSVRFLCGLIALLALIEAGSCLECYTCSSAQSPDCAYANSYTPKQRCFGQQNACLKEVFPNGITRHCGASLTCSSSVGCYTCYSDLCNSSSSIVPSFIISSIGIVILIVKYFK